MSMRMQAGTCSKCSQPNSLVGPLHGEKGGPLVCIPCGTDWHTEIERNRRKSERDGKLLFKAFGLEATSGNDELSVELLEDAIRLTHPDRHPPERRESAARVTAELLALKPFVLPKPKRNKYVEVPDRHLQLSVTPVTTTQQSQRETAEDPSRYPCTICCQTIPHDYCDSCRERFERECAEDRERANAKARERRARQRAARPARPCSTCGQKFRSKRADASYCSAACRQRAHRSRVTAKQFPKPGTPQTRNEQAAA